MKKLDRKYAAFELPEGFVLEIVGNDERTEYYISHEDYGVKSNMFSVESPFYECENELENDLVSTDYSREIECYRLTYMDN